jgi:hypothetical protein
MAKNIIFCADGTWNGPEDASGALSQAIHTPWTTPPFDHLGKKPRVVAKTDDFHPIIRQRWNASSPIYRPPALDGVWPLPATPGH